MKGDDNFVITYDTSVCDIIVTVQPTAATSPAVFTLRGSPNACMTDTVYGDYLKNMPLSTSSYLRVGVDVTTTEAIIFRPTL